VKIVVPLVALAFFPIAAWAQPARPAAVPSRSLTVEAGGAGNGDLRDGAGRTFSDIDVRHVGVAVGQRLALSGPWFVAVDLRYDRYELQLNPDIVPLPEKVQAIAFQTTVRKPLNERWTFLGSVKPSFASSGSLFDGDGLGINLGALGLYRQSDTLTWAFGVLYRTPAERFQLVPAIGFDWRPDEAWTVTVGFPRSSVTFAATPEVRVSFAGLAHGGTFHVSEPVGRTLSSVGPLHDSLLDYTEIRVGFGIEYRPQPALELSAMIGAIVHQEFDYYERDYRLKADAPTPFVTFGARVLF
jgi:hypothetical protein